MELPIQELSRNTVEEALQRSDVLGRIAVASPDGFLSVRQRVADRIGTFGPGIEAAVTLPLGTTEIRPAEKIIIHPLGLGNGVLGPRGEGGHQLLLAEIMATACEAPVVTVSSPTPESRYRLSPLDMWSFMHGNAHAYTKKIVRVLTDSEFPVRLDEVVIASSTQPGGAIGPRLAIDLQDHSSGNIRVSDVLVGDPATVVRRSLLKIVGDSTREEVEEYAARLGDGPLHDLYAMSIANEFPRSASSIEALDRITDTSHRRNLGRSPLHPTLVMTLATAAFMRYPSLFGDIAAAHQIDPETRFTIGFTNSRVTPEPALRAGFDAVTEQSPALLGKLSIVALRDEGRGVWDNPTVWPLLMTAS